MNTVAVERDGEIWTVTLNRPEARNAVDGPTARALAETFRAFDADAQARVAVLRGSGEHFCAGADLKAVAGGLGGHDAALTWSTDMTADGPMGPSRMQREQSGLPFGAALANEFAIGVGTLESGESVDGAQRFAAGTGRHGRFGKD